MAAKGFLDWELADIIEYCKKNKEIEWLKETAKKQVPTKVYPRKKVEKVDAEGNVTVVSVADKSQKPKVEMRRISFVQLKTEFLEKFNLMPEKKAKQPNMYDIIDAL
jgi:hypothetical protein